MLQIHHKIPKHMGGSDDPSNLVKLTVAEHAEEHRKLFEQHGHWQDELAWKGLAGIIGHEEVVQKLCQNAAKNQPKRFGKDHQCFGRTSITNGVDNKKIYLNTQTVPEGWWIGQTAKHKFQYKRTKEHKENHSKARSKSVNILMLNGEKLQFPSRKTAAEYLANKHGISFHYAATFMRENSNCNFDKYNIKQILCFDRETRSHKSQK